MYSNSFTKLNSFREALKILQYLESKFQYFFHRLVGSSYYWGDWSSEILRYVGGNRLVASWWCDDCSKLVDLKTLQSPDSLILVSLSPTSPLLRSQLSHNPSVYITFWSPHHFCDRCLLSKIVDRLLVVSKIVACCDLFVREQDCWLWLLQLCGERICG